MPRTAPDGYNVSCCYTALRRVGDKCSCGRSQMRASGDGYRIEHTIPLGADYTYDITVVYEGTNDSDTKTPLGEP